MPKELEYTPVIIIGAGRTGTNMLRDVICSLEGIGTWDCDEINPIWRYGNRHDETDLLPPERASERIKKYIRGRFTSLAKKQRLDYVVEKTCANSLRLGFVHEIFPKAKYILINRDGRDVAPSARIRWTAPFELNYTLKKLRYVPLRDFPFYIWKFGFNRLKQFFGSNEQLSFWGPVYPGIEEDFKNRSLLEVCALQWKACVAATQNDKQHLNPEQYAEVNYEQFVNDPKNELKRLLDFLGYDLEDSQIEAAVSKVSNRSIGSHKKLTLEEQQALNDICSDTLTKLGYSNE